VTQTPGRARARLIVLAALLATACTAAAPPEGGERADSDAIIVASFDFTESRVLGEIYAEALGDRGYPVEHLDGIASREIMEPALEQDHVDLVPEYLGSALLFLELGAGSSESRPRPAHSRLSAVFQERGVLVLDFARAEDRNEFVVTKTTADRLNLTSVSELQPVASGLTFGGPVECPARPLCLEGLEEVYGLQFERFQALDAGGPKTVAALQGGEIDVGLLFSTNPALARGDLVVLEDDKNLQPAENVVPVIRSEAVEAHGEEIIEVIDSVTAELTLAGLRSFNEQVEIDGRDPAVVARSWLQGLDGGS
jgi:osmoprotectant transport system substrate-binding protein